MKNNSGMGFIFMLIVLAIVAFLAIKNWDHVENGLSNLTHKKDNAEQTIENFKGQMEQIRENADRKIEEALPKD